MSILDSPITKQILVNLNASKEMHSARPVPHGTRVGLRVCPLKQDHQPIFVWHLAGTRDQGLWNTLQCQCLFNFIF